MKNIVKIFCSITVFTFCSIHFSEAQLIVNDPVASGNLLMSIEEATKQTVELQETTKLLQEGVELYSKVSKTIRNAKKVKSIIYKQAELVKLISKEFHRTEIGSVKMYGSYCRILKGIIQENLNNVEMLNTLISPGEKMTSGERLNILLKIDDLTNKSYRAFKQIQYQFNTDNEIILDRIKFDKKYKR